MQYAIIVVSHRRCQENLYEKFLVRQCRKVFEEHHMVMVVQPLAIDGRTRRLIDVKLLKKDLTIKTFGNGVTL